MKYCKYCGAELPDEAVFCTACGANQSLGEKKEAAATRPPESVSAPSAAHGTQNNYLGLTVLGFFIPLAALICYFLWKDTEPEKALAIGKGGLIEISLSPIVGLVVFVMMKEKYPDISRACGIAAIIGLVFGILMSILYSALFILLMMA